MSRKFLATLLLSAALPLAAFGAGGFLGVKVKPVEEGDAAGVLEVQEATAGGPAAAAGLKKGDLLLDMDGKPILGAEAFTTRIRQTAAGEVLTLLIRREGKEETLAVTLGERPAELDKPAKAEALQSPILGKPLPDLALAHPLQGEAWDPKDLKGKVLVIDLFQYGCPGCWRVSLPAAQKMHEEYRDDTRLRVLAIATAFEKAQYPVMADEDKIKGALKQAGYTFPVMRDKDEESVKILRFAGTYGTPMTVVVDAEGVVRWHGFNASPESVKEIHDLVAKLLPPAQEKGKAGHE